MIYCPECGAEYIEGIERCAGCDAPLVAFLPSGESVPESDLVELLRTTNMVELTVIKSLLDSMDLPCVVQGEEGLHMLPIGPAGGFLSSNSLGAVVRVRREDLDRAREILAGAAEAPEFEGDS